MGLSVRTVMGFYLRAAWRYPALLLTGLAGVPLVVAVTNILPALIVARVLDRLARHDYVPHHVWASFHTSLLLYAVVTLLPGVLAWRVVDIAAWRLEGNVSRDLAQRTFAHLLDESADFHAGTFGGSLVSGTTKLLGGYIRIFDTMWFQALPLVFSIAGVVAVMAPRSALYAVLVTVFSVVYVALAVAVSRPVRRAGAVHATADSRQTGALADAVTNVMAIKSFAREDHERERFAVLTETTRSTLRRLSRVAQTQQAVFGAVTSGTSALSLTVGVIAVVSLRADVGLVYLIVNYTSSLTQQLFQFSTQSLRMLNRAIGDASDMVGILAGRPAVGDPVDPVPAVVTEGRIDFEDVVFTHAGADDALFEGLTLHIRPGEKIGLVGHSGSGKTTMTKLLLRFADLDGGRILLDGQDIARMTQGDLHRAIAYVPQEPLLFHRSIAENVAYGRLEAAPHEVRAAARLANVDEFVQTLSDGYETLVGERGVKLSGGQRQRIAIARALIKDAPVLVLDEATSALDSESEALIQDALRHLMQGRTTLVIAHRLSTVQSMDRIVVLEEGRVVEEGTHAELVGAGGAYAGFWARQSDSFAAA